MTIDLSNTSCFRIVSERAKFFSCFAGNVCTCYSASPFLINLSRRYRKPLIGLFACILICLGTIMEAEAVRPPLKPLDSTKLHQMAVDAEVIAEGTVTSVTISKTLQPPLETVTIHAAITPGRILKGNKTMKTIGIEESYRQYSRNDGKSSHEGNKSTGESVTGVTAGPTPLVGKYREGFRVLVFLKPTGGSDQYRPLGSGDYDAYLGVFQITPEGVKSDHYALDETVSLHAQSAARFFDFIVSITGGQK